jgi:O-acetyl-ADP-ribose deacetylase (regulator of RNase III)
MQKLAALPCQKVGLIGVSGRNILDHRIDFLLRWLLDESQYDFPIPSSPEDQWRLFRALVNTRAPKPISTDFLTAQDAFLQSQIAAKGVTDIDDLCPVHDGLYLWRGDITTLKVSAIVNAANSVMLGCFMPNHGCIDNAIHTYAGVQLRLACAEIMERQGHPEPTGKAKMTAAYNLPSDFILHTVGPIVRSGLTQEHKRLLASCYRSCLALAEQNNMESVAFCCISTGEFQFPNEDAARIALTTVRDYLKSSSGVKRVVFNVFTKQDEHIYKELFQ